MKKVYLILFLIFTIPAYGQIKVSPSTIDFGTVNYWKNDTVWFTIKNKFKNTAVLLPIRYKEEYKLIPEKKKLQAGESMRLGLISYTNKKGNFKKNIPIYFGNSNNPVYLRIKGNIKSFDPSSMAICPSFNSPQDIKILVEIVYINSNTGRAIKPDKYWIESEKTSKEKLIQNDTVYKTTLRKGKYAAIGVREHYDDGEKMFTVKPGINRIIVPMVPLMVEQKEEERAIEKIWVNIQFIDANTKKPVLPDQKWVESEMDNNATLIRKDNLFKIELPMGTFFAIGKKENYKDGDKIFTVKKGMGIIKVPMTPLKIKVAKKYRVEIIFKDSETGKTLIPDDKWIESEMDNKGEMTLMDSTFLTSLPIGNYYAIGGKIGYKDGEKGFMVIEGKNWVEVLLRPKKEDDTEAEEELTKNYANNNLVFLIDVSGSMKKGKLDQLKESMKYLATQLRKEDRITIITFRYRAKVVLKTISGDKKDSIIKVINRLQAKGDSYGTNAVEVAYEKARKAFIKGGNNQLIVATDGVFNSGKTSKTKLFFIIRKGRNKGIYLSSLGYGNDKKGLNYLKRLANSGGGTFVQITKNYKQENLINMIKRQSRK